MLQERVLDYTTLKRRQDIENGIPPEQAQQIVDEYDPVVALAMLSVDRNSTLDQRIKCSAEVAQYVRPKLKSVEVKTDPEALESLAQRQELSARLVGLLEAAAAATKPPRATTLEEGGA